MSDPLGITGAQLAALREVMNPSSAPAEIGILLPNNQRQHCTLHTQKDVLPYALCQSRPEGTPASSVSPCKMGLCYQF